MAAVLALSVIAAYSAVATPASAQDAPDADASAWMLVDGESGERLAGENVDEELPMASTTKIMTALVVVDEVEDLDEEVTVSESAAEYAKPPYSNVGLRAGETLTARELLTAAMLQSGNDAAYALAEYAGGGSSERFVQMMNRRAEELGLEESSFENPVGLDGEDHHSSASDLAEMGRLALENPELREILATESAVMDTKQGREIPLQSTNELLAAYPPATGIKTGTTPDAGESLVASAELEDESYITVMLDAADRFGAAIEELEYGFSAYDRRDVIEAEKTYASEPLPARPDEEVELAAAQTAGGLVAADAEVERQVEVRELPASAEKGERLGRVVAEADGERVATAPLVAAEGYEEASMWRKLWYTASGVVGQGE